MIDVHYTTAITVLQFMMDSRNMDYDNRDHRGAMLDEIKANVQTATEYSRLASAGLKVATMMELDIERNRHNA